MKSKSINCILFIVFCCFFMVLSLFCFWPVSRGVCFFLSIPGELEILLWFYTFRRTVHLRGCSFLCLFLCLIKKYDLKFLPAAGELAELLLRFKFTTCCFIHDYWSPLTAFIATLGEPEVANSTGNQPAGWQSAHPWPQHCTEADLRLQAGDCGWTPLLLPSQTHQLPAPGEAVHGVSVNSYRWGCTHSVSVNSCWYIFNNRDC